MCVHACVSVLFERVCGIKSGQGACWWQWHVQLRAAAGGEWEGVSIEVRECADCGLRVHVYVCCLRRCGRQGRGQEAVGVTVNRHIDHTTHTQTHENTNIGAAGRRRSGTVRGGAGE